MQGKKITKKQWDEFLKTLEEVIGLVSVASEKTGIGRSAIYKHRRENPDYAKEMDDIVVHMGIPLATDKLLDLVFKGEFSAIKYYLTTKGGKAWQVTEGREHSGKIETEMTVKTDRSPNRLKAKRAYEQAEKDTIYGRTPKRGQPAGVGKGKANQKRKGKAN